MVVYSIKDMENLSGVKAHTLRIWEKRYDIIHPKRTATNIRYYTDEDLRHLLNVCYLYKKGYKISKIAEMNEDDLKQTISDYSLVDLNEKDKVDTLMMFILELDAYNLNKVLDHSIEQKGLEETMNDLIYPLLDRLSMKWLAGSFQSVHESFVTQIIRAKIQIAIESAPEQPNFSPTYIIYLPESEQQELSMLYMHFLLKKNRCKVINLGNDVSLKDVIASAEVLKPNYIFTIINNELKQGSFKNYIEELTSCENYERLLITGYQTVAQSIKWPANTTVFKNLGEMLNFIIDKKSES